ncbi:MAG TPA: flagellar hook-associated protein FlgL [Steroidobacteraceae bacterium]|nr:flagellar hook-associated protein FlgL [Steroidobacteraceae bacterium]
MRISTAGIHQKAVSSMLQQQTVLSRTQNQIASGKRIQSPADDPVAAVHLLELDRALTEMDQFDRNSSAASNRLTLEEQALSDAGTLLQGIQELAVQANSAAIDAGGRGMLADELRGRLQELIALGNTRDANGEYLFAGFATKTQPFAQNGTSVSYFGDQGSRTIQVSPTQRVADSHSGYETFVVVPEGNGTFVTSVNTANTGSGSIASGSVTDASLWVPDDYTLRFTSGTTYEVVNSAAAIVATGTYTPTTESTSIAFNGIQVNFSGSPATGDTFSIARSRTEDIFTTLNNLVDTLESSTAAGPDRAQFTSNMASALTQLQQTADHLLSVRAQVGTRLSGLETAQSSREDQKLELQRMQGELRDLDYAEAISRMNVQLVGLQAAQASYSRISQLSLFDYLR